MLVSLKNICTVITDGSHYSPLGLKSGYPMLSVKDMEEYGFNYSNCKFISKEDYITLVKNGCKPLKNDVLIAKDGSYLKEVFVVKEEKEEVILSSIAILRPNFNLVNPYYLAYYLKSNHIKDVVSSKYVTGSVLKRIILKNFENIEIALPSLEIQNKIASILSSIDTQITRNNTLVKRLQVLSQAIFNRFLASENNFVSLVDFPYIQILKPGIKRFEGVKHYVATAEVEGEKLNFDSSLIEYETRENRANMQPIKNSVWFAKLKKSVKHIYISNKDDYLINNYVFSTGFCGIKCDEIAFEYMINYLNLPYFENLKDILSHGATQEGINNEDLKLFKINLPTREVLAKFHNETKEIHNYISGINQTTYKLECLRKTLLPLLINGQLK